MQNDPHISLVNWVITLYVCMCRHYRLQTNRSWKDSGVCDGVGHRQLATKGVQLKPPAQIFPFTHKVTAAQSIWLWSRTKLQDYVSSNCHNSVDVTPHSLLIHCCPQKAERDAWASPCSAAVEWLTRDIVMCLCWLAMGGPERLHNQTNPNWLILLPSRVGDGIFRNSSTHSDQNKIKSSTA